MGDNRNTPSAELLATIAEGRQKGLTYAEIGKKVGKTAAAVIGIADRHLKSVPRRVKRFETYDVKPRQERRPSRRKAVEPVVETVQHGEPSPPRRFSWQDHV